MAAIAHRRASGFGAIFSLWIDSELIRRHGGQVRTMCTPAHRGILGETGKNRSANHANGPQPSVRSVS